MKIKYQEHNIKDIFRYFVKGFELKADQKIQNWDSNYDPHTGKVIFTLYVEGDERESQ